MKFLLLIAKSARRSRRRTALTALSVAIAVFLFASLRAVLDGFNAGTEGGRLALDLSSTINIKQVNTYSWHPNTRGPQVYKLFGSDGSGKDFSASPKKGTDPEKAGWKLIATIDTRPKTGEAGGQYGVSVADAAGAIGKYRYLLFDMSRTEADDEFGNTFYSEIDVIEQK